MKTKKKSTNTFKFQSFTKRISAIKITVFSQSGEKFHGIPDNDKDTFFRETLEKISEMDCSLDFTALYRALRPLVQSFNLVLFNKDKITVLLKQYLSLEGSLATKACLQLLASLSRDLQKDFFPIFEQLFHTLIQLLKRMDAELIEETFVCFAYIFKCTWRYMVNEVCHIFRNFKCLLSDKKVHIQSFAAESCAFLIQKTKDKKAIILHLFEEISKEPVLAVGVGRLIFQTIKGVHKQFISSAKEILNLCLQMFHNSSIDSNLVFIALETTWVCSLKHSSIEYSGLLFHSIYESIESLPHTSTEYSSIVPYYFKLLNVGVQQQGGYYVGDQVKLFEVLNQHLTSLTIDCEDLIASLLLLLKSSIEVYNLQVPDTILTEVFSKLLSNETVVLIEKLNFCQSLFCCNKFETNLREAVLDFISKCLLGYVSTESKEVYCKDKKIIFEFLVELIHKDMNLGEPFCVYGDEFAQLEFPVSTTELSTIENMLLCELDVQLWNDDIQWIWIIVTCLCHCRPNDKTQVVNALSTITTHGLLICEEDVVGNEQLFTLAHCIKAILLLEKTTATILKIIPWEGMVKLIRKFPSNEHIFQAFEAFCSCITDEKQLFTRDCLENLYQIIKFNLNSPHSLLCLLTLKILRCFDSHSSDISIDDADMDAEGDNVLQYSIDALNINVSLNTYRERLIIMRQLTWNSNMLKLHADAALRFLIGNLYVNFSVMWEEVYDMIATHADQRNESFWDVWKEMLDGAADRCASSESHTPIDCKVGTFSKYFTAVSVTKDQMRVDHKNFRLLLWNTMGKFPALVEKKVKCVVPLFLRFMRDEYSRIDEMVAKKQDLRIKDALDLDSTGCKVEKGKGKSEFEALCAHLQVFSTFKKPKAFENEFQLYQMYLEFLTSKDNKIQTLAISCLMTYANPYMLPYKENFDRLMNDTYFRDELVFFSTTTSDDEENQGMNQEHLKQLLPILIRLLYGKLQRRSGLGISGKSSSSARRNIIMNFLANCSDEDVQPFFQLILQPFNILKDVTFPHLSVDITCIVPLRKQTGFLNMFSTVLKKLPRKSELYLPQIFDVLLKLLWSCSEILKLKEQVHASYNRRLKNIRRVGLERLNELFETQSGFDFKHYIVEIFAAAVWPQLPEMITDSAQCATPLLKLLITWSKSTQYHCFLGKVDDDGKSPFSSLVQMLNEKSLSRDVENLIMIVTANLLSIENVGNESERRVEMGNTADVLSEGVHLVQPFIKDILNHISANLLSKTKDHKKKQMMKNVLPYIQFSVLSHLSKFVTNTEQCSLLVSILFPLLQCINSEDTQLYILRTISNMLPQLESIDCYLNLVPSLFSMIHTRAPRQIFCEVYLKMTENNDNLKVIGDLVDRINSWDIKRLDEPDYDKRLSAFREINEQMEAARWNKDQILPILHNALFFLLTTEDMSLRNAASNCIEHVIHFVELQYDDLFHVIILKTLFPFIKSGLKSKKEEVQVEFISLLGLLVKTFKHRQFVDMSSLCSDDPETDFFKNFVHIQVHRKIRAIHRLSLLCTEGKISVQNMFFIIMPMISPAIFSKLAASKDHNLLTETISAIGCIMKQMPWAKYSHVLKNYLKVMQKDFRNQKNILRVLMAILNNFHFDLSPLEIEEESKLLATTGVPAILENKVPNMINDNSEITVKESEASNTNDIPEISENGDVDVDGEEETEEIEDNESSCEDGAPSNDALKKIYAALTNNIIPQLNRFLKKKGTYDSDKLNYKEVDEKEMMKLPMELALAQLLQQLPNRILHLNLPGLLLRVSQSLRSHSKEVRDAGRDTLKKISLSLGAKYLPMVVSEMKSLLQHGYQRHVLSYTLHSILDNMVGILNEGDLDECIQDTMEIVVDELVGILGEEKEVSAISNKLHEAQHRKSNETLEILAKYISNEKIGQVIAPLKKELDVLQNHTSINKIEEVLLHTANGLQSNKSLSDEDILIFIHGVISDAMLITSNKQDRCETLEVEENYKPDEKKDCYTLTTTPTRGGDAPTKSDKTNNHVLVNFGLHLLNNCLKRQRFTESNLHHVRMLDPIIPLVMNNILSKYNKIVSLAIKSLCFLFKFPLPSTKTYFSTLGKNLFKIMKTFIQDGASKGKNVELISSSFKAMTVLIRDYKEFIITDNQLKILLSLVEEDIHISSRQIVALPLLRAILAKKVNHIGIQGIIQKISDLSVRDFDPAIQLQCRKIVLQYLLDYPLGKKIVNHFDFYISHLSYEEESGRVSVLEMITLIVNNLPESLLFAYAGYIFIPLVMMLVNDDSATCRKMCACTIKTFIQKMDVNTRDEMFEIVTNFSKNSKPVLQLVSIQLIGLFVEVEKKAFSRHLEGILPSLIEHLQRHDTSLDATDEEKARDKFLYNALNCLLKVFNESDLLGSNERYVNRLRHVCSLCKDHLLHPHTWIRLATSQLFTLYFGSVKVEDFGKEPQLDEQSNMENNDNVKELCMLFVAQLKDPQLSKDVADQATKNLVFLSRVVKDLDPLTNVQGDTESVKDNGDLAYSEKSLSVKSMIKKLSKLASYEASHNPKETLKRTCVLRLVASLSLCLGEPYLKDYLVDLLRPIHREVSSSPDEDTPLYVLAHEVLELIRSIVKKDVFAEAYSEMQKNHTDRKELRKRKLATMAITDPVHHALRKQKRHLLKRDQRKRKFCEQKPFKKSKKMRACIESNN